MDKRLLTTCDIFELQGLDKIKESIEESEREPGRPVTMRGILQKADTLNQNGRIYPYAILEREIRNYQKFIAENRALGELDHPDTSVVNLKNASHIVKEASIDQQGVVSGTVEILDTPSGQTLKALIKSGVKLGISSRGVGSTKQRGDYYEVQEDFQLICWDFVSEPSTPGAFMLPEGKRIEQVELNEVFNKTDRINRIVTDILMKGKK
jgi:hypothetical protein